MHTSSARARREKTTRPRDRERLSQRAVQNRLEKEGS
jgi:hypothetical protein